mgnify:CR=1 FL=1
MNHAFLGYEKKATSYPIRPPTVRPIGGIKQLQFSHGLPIGSFLSNAYLLCCPAPVVRCSLCVLDHTGAAKRWKRKSIPNLGASNNAGHEHDDKQQPPTADPHAAAVGRRHRPPAHINHRHTRTAARRVGRPNSNRPAHFFSPGQQWRSYA